MLTIPQKFANVKLELRNILYNWNPSDVVSQGKIDINKLVEELLLIKLKGEDEE